MMIRDLLNGEGGEWQKKALQALAKHMKGFGGGGSSSAAAERNTIGGAQQ
jgi:hypothetical protein